MTELKGIQNSPPGSPAERDLFVVGTEGSGAWNGQDGKLAARLGTAWVFSTPAPGQEFYDRGDDAVWFYDGSNWWKKGTMASCRTGMQGPGLGS